MGEPVQVAAGRPRNATIDQQVLAAALAEIADVGIAAFSLVAVARRAGVAKNTVYLRWPERDELIRAALMSGQRSERPARTGHLATDLRSLAQEFADGFASDVGLTSYYQLSVTSHNDPVMWAWGKAHIIDPAHAIPEEMIRQAQRRGDAREDVDAGVVARMMVGGIFAEGILQTPHGRVEAAFLDDLVTNVLRLLTPDQT